ncbi:MarR family winged helix-turn-helix transcriptional regulator [Marinilactibacillus sp. Marseille-P9653]|uniref:MarR family winged helix-turn-helix transcriptional regulator n=1 Tax=Marinilactibacillus sp. Marseille-P9653 TaxID=2866583 RepID=UPI001CE4791F|nr:MarR family transcriptional regulator [Marinilactibacillus sp. Marseille-P9653]
MDPHGTIGYELRELSILFVRYIEKEKAGKNFEEMHRMQAWALSFLYENQHKPIFQKDIEKEFSIRKSTTSNLVKRLKNNGYIDERKGTQTDKRLKEIVLTDKAIEQINAFKPYIEKLEETITQGIDEAELAQFKATLSKIKANFK